MASKVGDGSPARITVRRTRLSTLVAQVRACTLCAASLPLPPRPLLQIDAAAKILVAGQAPGRRAHESGIPFDDVSGDRLRAWMGIDREVFCDARRIAIVPMGLCYPGTGRGGDLAPRPECAPAWRARLLAGLPKLQLTLVIGRYALDWHLPQYRGAGVTDAVRDWRRHGSALLPLPHPSPRNQRWLRDHPWFEAEVLPVLRERVAALVS
ncbi:MAG: uracil-DNA glycosylase family protein [Burkholderiales bacterium]|nr:uracil-DNA glycosylase family protein [Burkholderiales bacterium]